MELRTGCNNFILDRPCKYQKEDISLICDNACKYFEPAGIRILILKFAALGDVLRTTGILKLLSAKYNNSSIYWVTCEKAVPLLDNIKYIKEVIAYNAESLPGLLLESYDVLINLDLSRDAMSLATLIKSKEKFGFGFDEKMLPVCYTDSAKEWFILSHNDSLKKKNKLTCQEHYLKIAGISGYGSNKDYPIEIHLTGQETSFAGKFAAKNKIKPGDLIIGLNTGGGDTWEKKEWPASYTIQLINILCKWNKSVKILLYGGKKETKRNNGMISKINKKYRRQVIDTGTGNSLRQFISLANLSSIIVTSDTLAVHIAAGLGKKIVALFGPTSSSEIEIYDNGIKLAAPLDCTGCYKRRCAVKPDCMELIKPETVLASIEKLA